MIFKRKELTSTLMQMIQATENKEIQTSEEFLNRLKNELSKRKIITFNKATD